MRELVNGATGWRAVAGFARMPLELIWELADYWWATKHPWVDTRPEAPWTDGVVD